MFFYCTPFFLLSLPANHLNHWIILGLYIFPPPFFSPLNKRSIPYYIRKSIETNWPALENWDTFQTQGIRDIDRGLLPPTHTPLRCPTFLQTQERSPSPREHTLAALHIFHKMAYSSLTKLWTWTRERGTQCHGYIFHRILSVVMGKGWLNGGFAVTLACMYKLSIEVL